MKRKIIMSVSMFVLTAAVLAGCASSDSQEEAKMQETAESSEPEEVSEEQKRPEEPEETPAAVLEDGTYTAVCLLMCQSTVKEKGL